jgi:16S rRNA (cytosine1402-N4)-methyltransferase
VSWHHEPVLVEAVLSFLANGPGLYLDATLGDGGHAEALLRAEPGARLLGCDRDPRALDVAGRRLRSFGERVSLAHATFREIPAAHAALGGELFTGALFDLGLSSPQIDDPDRGMSFASSGPLDMRMDPSRGRTLAERLADANERELMLVLREHGDVAGAPRLARALVRAARDGALATTLDLARAVERTFGGRVHPRRFAQVFQALRIWVNDEDVELEAALDWLASATREGGVVVTLAYHSGEDRRIKHALRGSPRHERRLPLPVQPELPEKRWESLTRSVVRPDPDETLRNPRARSARLRAFRRSPS